MRASTLALTVLLALPAQAIAQDTLPVLPPGMPGVGAPDQPEDSVEEWRQLQEDARTPVASIPRLDVPGPLPSGSRMVFTRDSIDWSGALTVSDLVAQVPGAWLWRAGGVGRPEPVAYAGRGSASVEYLVDGLPYLALGPDSVSTDPATLPLELFSRVEVERWPGQLRVHLFTRSHDRLAAKSNILLSAGPSSYKQYGAALERRSRGGLGFGAGLDYREAPPPSGSTGQYKGTHLWGQVSYVPAPNSGVVLQYLSSSLDRDLFSDGAITGERIEGRRGEVMLRGFVGNAAGAAGQGVRFDLLAQRSGFDSMGVDQSVWRAGGGLTWRSARTSARVLGLWANRWTPLDLQAGASIAPAPLVTLSVDGRYQAHDGERSSRWIGGRAGIGLPGGASVFGSARLGQAVAAPAVLASPEQDVSEAEVGLLWDRDWIGVEGRISRTGAFVPLAYQEIPLVTTLADVPATTWVSVGGRLKPLDWISFRGWYSQPSGSTAPGGAPARHWTLTGTIRTKFLRTFRSGAFDLKLEAGYEGWRAGVLGFDALGGPVTVNEAHYLRTRVQVAIESFSIFWESRNVLDETENPVPGFRIPQYSGAFGVRWGFTN